MKVWALILSFVLCGLGLALVYVYFNSFGFVLDGIGFMLFIYSIYPVREQRRAYFDKSSYQKNIYEEDYKCGNCRIFGNKGCPRGEKLINAKPCENFIGKIFEE